MGESKLTSKRYKAALVLLIFANIKNGIGERDIIID